MGEAVNVLGSIKQPDIVSPLQIAMRMLDPNSEAKTQRMFAENQMARQSAEDYRRQKEDEEKQAERERQHKIDQAEQVVRIGQMLRTPGGAGPAAALGDAYGIDVHPLLAATAAAHAPASDAVDQALAEAGPSAGPPPGPELGPAGYPAPEAPPAAPAAPTDVDPGVAAIMSGRTVQHAPEGDFVLPEGTPANLATAAEHQGYVPRGSVALPPEAGPAALPAPSDLEALMSRAAPIPAPPAHEMPTNPLYEAVLGGHHYQLPAEQMAPGLGEKYDAVFRFAMQQPGAKPMDALKVALAEKEKDDATTAAHQRVMDALGGRNAETDKRDAQYRLTAEELKAREASREANARTVARIRAAAQGATDPKQAAGLTKLLEMKESGATDSEINDAAVALGVPTKAWQAPVKNVQTEAVAGNRATEKREGLVATDENGKTLGIWKNPQVGADMTKKIQAWAQVKDRYQALIDDIKQNGTRVSPTDFKGTQRRESLAGDVQSAARVYNQLGGTDASLRLEHQILSDAGTFGNGLIRGANVDVLQHLYNEADKLHGERLNTALRPGGGSELPKPITHKKGAGSPASTGGGPDLDALEAWSAGLAGK